jgi:CubicO group peptidase (beta-lactamase class C family)
VVTGADAGAQVMTAGTLRVGSDAPVGPSTMFRLMSMTKAFASVAALQLVERGG